MGVTLLQLRTRARQRADMENSNFIEDSELNSYVNASLAELYDLLVSAYGEDYFIADPLNFSTVSGTAEYALPADFYKLRGLDCNINGNDWFSIRAFNFNERNRNQDTTWGLIGGPNIRYRIMGENLKITPMPNGVYNLRMWYIPLAPTLAADSDSFNDINNFSEYVVVDAAIKMLQKEESDVSILMNQKMALKRRLEEMAANRDAGQPMSVSDIYAENNEFWFWRA